MAEPMLSMTGLEQTVRALRALPAELSSRNGGPVRAALFAAAKVVRGEAQRLAPVGKGTPNPGNLRANVFASRNRDPRRIGAAEHYFVSVRSGRRGLFSRKIGLNTRSLMGRDAYYWWWVEFGTSKQPAQPFLRAAFEAKKQEALRVFEQTLARAVAAAARRAQKRGGSR